MSSLIEREGSGHLGRAWQKCVRGSQFLDAVSDMVFGALLVLVGIALLVADVLIGPPDTAAVVVEVGGLLIAGVLYAAWGFRKTKRWFLPG